MAKRSRRGVARVPASESRALLAQLEPRGTAGFTFHEQKRALAYDFHRHSRHQLLYALSGSARLELADATFVLPPQRAAFIPAGLRHATLVGDASTVSVFLDRRLVPAPPSDVCIIAASPLLRELVNHAQRWSATRGVRDRTADAFFRCFGLLCSEWLAQPLAARLPRGASPACQAALAYVQADPAAATLHGAARAAGASSRTLHRRLRDELGIGFRAIVTQARMVQATAELARPQQRVTDVSYALGYRSLSAFAKAFREHTGESPRAYQKRLLASAG